MRRMIFSAIAAFALGAAFWSCSGPKTEDWQNASGAVWNTVYNITWQGEEVLSDSIQGVFEAVNNSLSTFNPNSVTSRINRNETDIVDHHFRTIFNVSSRVARMSNNIFDPTVGPLVDLWGFGTAEGRARADSLGINFNVGQGAIDNALSMVGIQECHIEYPNVMKKGPGTTFNFSAIAKGYGCDLIGDMFKRNGVKNFLIEIGGEILTSGLSPDGHVWTIQIDAPEYNPGAPTHKQLTVFHTTNRGIATSGNYRNFRQSANGRIGHTINPKTGRPAESDVVSATIIAPNAALADAWATVCMIVPSDTAMALLNNVPKLQGLLVVATPGDSLRLIHTAGFPR